LEGNVLMPLIFYRTVHIPPAIGVVSQILFGSLMGLMGFVLAIPLMAVLIKFVKMVYVEDVLGDKSVEQ
jgi:predicted PurR-regulated permease PerM